MPGTAWIRLADLRVPRPSVWRLGITLGLLVARRRDKAAFEAAIRVGEDIGQSVLTRWADTDAQTAAMLDLTHKLVRLTWAVVVLTVVVLAATLYVGLR